MLQGPDGLLHGDHAADGGAVGVATLFGGAAARTLNPADALGMAAVAGPLELAARGSGGAHELLELQVGEHVREAGVAVPLLHGSGVPGLGAAGQHHRTHLQALLDLFLVQVDGLGRAHLDALAAAVALAHVDGKGLGSGLGVAQAGGRAGVQARRKADGSLGTGGQTGSAGVAAVHINEARAGEHLGVEVPGLALQGHQLGQGHGLHGAGAARLVGIGGQITDVAVIGGELPVQQGEKTAQSRFFLQQIHLPTCLGQIVGGFYSGYAAAQNQHRVARTLAVVLVHLARPF